MIKICFAEGKDGNTKNASEFSTMQDLISQYIGFALKPLSRTGLESQGGERALLSKKSKPYPLSP